MNEKIAYILTEAVTVTSAMDSLQDDDVEYFDTQEEAQETMKDDPEAYENYSIFKVTVSEI